MARPSSSGSTGAETVRDALDLPQACPVIHHRRHQRQGSLLPCSRRVAGRPGYRVGCPHLAAPPLGTTSVSGSTGATPTRPVEAFAEVERRPGEIPLTYFEHGTLAAWVAFCRAGPDAIILPRWAGRPSRRRQCLRARLRHHRHQRGDGPHGLPRRHPRGDRLREGRYLPRRPSGDLGDPMPPASLGFTRRPSAPLWVTGAISASPATRASGPSGWRRQPRRAGLSGAARGPTSCSTRRR